MDGSVGGIGNASASGAVALKGGYIGQLTEVTNLTVSAVPSAMNEGGSSQLSGIAGLDDATVVAIEGSNVVWCAPVYPIGAIGPDGQATLANVYADTSGVVTGRYLGVAGSRVILVSDSIPDNFGLYAGDQVPDGWQVSYFGENNPDGTASATNATGRNNLYAYVADLCPTNPGACFGIAAISNNLSGRKVWFGATSTGRVYRLAYATDLAGTWTNLPGGAWSPGEAGSMSLLDPNGATRRFYRVHVALPR
jgi:hypothetical protein